MKKSLENWEMESCYQFLRKNVDADEIRAQG